MDKRIKLHNSEKIHKYLKDTYQLKLEMKTKLIQNLKS